MDVVLYNIQTGYNLDRINANFDKIETCLNEEVLHRDVAGNNTMSCDIDMNSYTLLNLPTPVDNTSPATKEYVDQAALGNITLTTANVDPSTDRNYVTDAQLALLVTPSTIVAGSANTLATPRTINGVSFDGSANITIVDSTKSPIVLTVTPISSTTYTLQASDAGTVLEFTSNSPITLNVPGNVAGVAGFNCLVVQRGTGQITFTATASAVLQNVDGHTKTYSQYAQVAIIGLGSNEVNFAGRTA